MLLSSLAITSYKNEKEKCSQRITNSLTWQKSQNPHEPNQEDPLVGTGAEMQEIS